MVHPRQPRLPITLQTRLKLSGSTRFPLFTLAYARVAGDEGAIDGFFRFCDRTAEAEPLAAGQLSEDGHCSYSPDRQWVLNDTYPGTAYDCRTLMLVRASDGAIFEIGRFYSPMPDQAEIRCDLHPRWRPDGRADCIDSVHEGRRAMYTIDVGPVIDDSADKREA